MPHTDARRNHALRPKSPLAFLGLSGLITLLAVFANFMRPAAHAPRRGEPLRGPARAGALLLIAVCGCLTAAAQTTHFVELASVNAAGTQAAGGTSARPRSSDDGRFVVFQSNANDLDPKDTDFLLDVFVRDLLLDTTQLVSVNAAGTGSGDGESRWASITPDGRYVVFHSNAADLTADSVSVAGRIYVRDLVAQKTMLVNLDSSGAPLNPSFNPDSPSVDVSITPDGRYVIFRSGKDIYRRDLAAGTTALVSVNAAGTGGGDGTSSGASITPDGRFVVFQSIATDLVSPPTAGGGMFNVFRRDLQTNTTVLVSVSNDGSVNGRGGSQAVVSDDGQVVAYTGASANLVGPDNAVKLTTSVYVRNLADNTTTLVSEPQVFDGTKPTIPPSLMPQISADGRYVFYLRTEFAFSDGLNRPPARDRVFRRDRQTGALLELPLVPTDICDRGFDCLIFVPGFVTSRDGRYVAYRQREEPRLPTPFPSPFSTAIVVHDVFTGGADVVNGFSGVPINPADVFTNILSPGSVAAGGKVAFSSGLSHSPADTNIREDIYLFAPAAQTRVAFNRAGYDVGEDGGHLATQTIILRRRGLAVDTASAVRLTTSDGTATAGSDYVPLSETLTFAPGETEKAVTVQIIDDDVLEPAETLHLTLGDPTANSALGAQSSTTLTIGDNDLHTVQFTPFLSPSPFERFAFEPAGSALLTVTRTGATSQPVSVDYATSDGTASERSDYITAAGRLTFAPGETTKTIRVFIVNDAHVESDETFTVTLSNLRGANAVLGAERTREVIIFSEDPAPPGPNPIADSQFFVRQHYLDFFSREPDAPGLAHWTNVANGCGDPDLLVCRINVSAAFFLSLEFRDTGYLVERAYKAAYGDAVGTSTLGGTPHTLPVPVIRFQEFLPDTQEIGRGVVVLAPGWEELLESNKRAYFLGFVQRARFTTAFPLTMPPAEFVDRLNQRAGNPLDAAERAALINELTADNTTAGRASVLRKVAEDPTLADAEINRAFVLMQYFGYLRRNPDDAPEAGRDHTGYEFWLRNLERFNGNFVHAELVKAFILSAEYRQRFGQ